MVIAVGIDLGIRSGAVVVVEFEVYPALMVTGMTTTWKGQRARGKRNASKRPDLDVTELARIGQKQLGGIPESVFEVPGRIVGIDWGLHEAYWGSRKPALQKAFLAGYVYRRLLGLGAMPLFIPPIQVRKYLGLKANATKEQVQLAFLPSVGSHLHAAFNAMNEHEIDAVVLATLAYLTFTASGTPRDA